MDFRASEGVPLNGESLSHLGGLGRGTSRPGIAGNPLTGVSKEESESHPDQTLEMILRVARHSLEARRMALLRFGDCISKLIVVSLLFRLKDMFPRRAI